MHLAIKKIQLESQFYREIGVINMDAQAINNSSTMHTKGIMNLPNKGEERFSLLVLS